MDNACALFFAPPSGSSYRLNHNSPPRAPSGPHPSPTPPPPAPPHHHHHHHHPSLPQHTAQSPLHNQHDPSAHPTSTPPPAGLAQTPLFPSSPAPPPPSINSASAMLSPPPFPQYPISMSVPERGHSWMEWQRKRLSAFGRSSTSSALPSAHGAVGGTCTTTTTTTTGTSAANLFGKSLSGAAGLPPTPVAASPVYYHLLEEEDPTRNTILSEKRRRRRESHNAVERRRRDNINERIADLARLLPDALSSSPHSTCNLNNSNTNGGGGSCQSHSAGPATAPSTPTTPTTSCATTASTGGGGAAHKPNKGQILQKSVVYVRTLQSVIKEASERLAELEGALKSMGVEVGTYDADRRIQKLCGEAEAEATAAAAAAAASQQHTPPLPFETGRTGSFALPMGTCGDFLSRGAASAPQNLGRDEIDSPEPMKAPRPPRVNPKVALFKGFMPMNNAGTPPTIPESCSYDGTNGATPTPTTPGSSTPTPISGTTPPGYGIVMSPTMGHTHPHHHQHHHQPLNAPATTRVTAIGGISAHLAQAAATTDANTSATVTTTSAGPRPMTAPSQSLSSPLQSQYHRHRLGQQDTPMTF